MNRTPRVYFSFRSPFSWMGVERLRRALPDVHDALEFVPYWEPDAATTQALDARGAALQYVQMSKAKHLYILQDTKRLATALGLTMVWPVDITPWWEVPHLAWLRARRLGAAKAFYEAVVAARWVRGEPICDPAVIRRVARSVGLDGDAVADAIDDRDVRAEGVQCLVDAYDDDIFGVPYFRVGRHRFWGVDRVDAFLGVLRPAAARDAIALAIDAAAGTTAPEFPAAVGQAVGCFDTDSAGGCG